MMDIKGLKVAPQYNKIRTENERANTQQLTEQF